MTKYYLGLIATIVLSSLCWYNFSINIHGGSTGDMPFYVPLFVPGLLFSIFIGIALWKTSSMVECLISFTTLCMCYAFIAILTLYTAGLIIPLAGAAGGALVNFTLTERLKRKISYKKFIGFGFLATLPGFLLFFINLSPGEGIIFASVTGLWQAVIGIMFIREIHKKEDGIENNFDKELKQYLNEGVNKTHRQ